MNEVADNTVKICTIYDLDVNAEPYTVTYEATLNDTYTLDVDETGHVEKADLQEAVTTLYDDEAIARTMTMVITAYVNVSEEITKKDATPIELTVTPESASIQTLYVPGGYQQWNAATAPTVYSKRNDMIYDGYADIRNGDWSEGFSFLTGPAWPEDGNNYKVYGVDSEGPAGTLKEGSQTSIEVAEEGFYRLTVDMSNTPYTYTAVKTKWGIIGDATSAGWDTNNAIPLMLDTDTGEWMTTINLEGNKALKFVANNSPEINFGGDLDNLEYGGANIITPETGKYLVILDLRDPKAYTASLILYLN